MMEDKIMVDKLFAELEKNDWLIEHTLNFGGNLCDVEIEIDVDGEGIEPEQIKAFQCFFERWSTIQENLIEALIEYYNESERFSVGPSDEKELLEWWPEINTKEELLQAVILETILVGSDASQEDGRTVYLLFSRTWGGEDIENNGIGVCCVNEEIDEIGYKDIAY